MPTITVAIPTRDRRATLLPLLDAVRPQARAIAAEVLVVDNGSSDGTPEALARVPDVRCVVEPTTGATRARNAALRLARGDVVAFIDDDAVPAPGWLAALTAPLAEPGVACTGGRVRLRFAGSPPAWWSEALATYLAAYDLGDAPVALATRPWYDAPRGLDMAVARAAAVAVGGFNLRLGPLGRRPSVGEEADLLLRLHAAGYTSRYVPDAVVEHLVDPERLAPGWFYRRAFWTGWSEAIIGLAHRPLRGVLGLLRWHYRTRALRLPSRTACPDAAGVRRECERREALGYVLGLARHLPVRRLVVRGDVGAHST